MPTPATQKQARFRGSVTPASKALELGLHQMEPGRRHGRSTVYSGTAVIPARATRTSRRRIKIRMAPCTALFDSPVAVAIS
jgi:hypothetical protein